MQGDYFKPSCLYAIPCFSAITALIPSAALASFYLTLKIHLRCFVCELLLNPPQRVQHYFFVLKIYYQRQNCSTINLTLHNIFFSQLLPLSNSNDFESQDLNHLPLSPHLDIQELTHLKVTFYPLLCFLIMNHNFLFLCIMSSNFYWILDIVANTL